MSFNTYKHRKPDKVKKHLAQVLLNQHQLRHSERLVQWSHATLWLTLLMELHCLVMQAESEQSTCCIPSNRCLTPPLAEQPLRSEMGGQAAREKTSKWQHKPQSQYLDWKMYSVLREQEFSLSSWCSVPVTLRLRMILSPFQQESGMRIVRALRSRSYFNLCVCVCVGF